MARKKKEIPKYGTVVLKGVEYYRTRIEDADGRRVALYARTPEELLEKVEEAQRQIENAVFRRTTPTVAEYCERCHQGASSVCVCNDWSVCWLAAGRNLGVKMGLCVS